MIQAAPDAGGASFEDGLAKLQEAMKPSGETGDPDRKRAAARLSALVKSEDESLAAFKKRHLPGRQVEDHVVQDLRELAVAVSRLVAIAGRGPGVESMIANLRRALLPNLERLEREAAEFVPDAQPVMQMPEETLPTSPDQADPNAPVAPPAIVPLQIVPDAQTSFPKPSFAQAPTRHLRDAASVPVAARPVTAEIPSAAMRSAASAVPAWVAEPTPTGVANPSFGSRPEPSPDAALSDDELAPMHPTPAFTPKLHIDPVMPFGAGSASPVAPGRSAAPPRPDDAVAATPRSSHGAPTRANLGQTLDPDAAPVSRGLPFGSALPPHLGHIGVEAYAVFFALMLVYPDRQADIFAQYGLRDRGDKEALDRYWLAKLTEDRALSAQWVMLRDQAVAHYRATR